MAQVLARRLASMIHELVELLAQSQKEESSRRAPLKMLQKHLFSKP
jgi:hypothetical protein